MWHDNSGLVWFHCSWGTNYMYVILLWKMFLIRSIGCCALYLTVMLCAMVDITALYQKFLKESRYFSLLTTTICPLGHVPVDWKIWSGCQRSGIKKLKNCLKETNCCKWWKFAFKLRTLKNCLEETNCYKGWKFAFKKCCSSSSGTSSSLCSSTKSPGINNNLLNPVGKTAKTSLLRIKFAIPFLSLVL